MTTVDATTRTPVGGQVARRQVSESWRRRLPLLPALVFTIALTQIPFVMSVYYSLTDWKVVPPSPREFVGLDNYTHLFSDHFFRDAAVTTVELTVFPVLGALVIGGGRRSPRRRAGLRRR